MSTQGTENHLALAAELREVAPDVRSWASHMRAAALMERAADVIERLAEFDPDIDVSPGEN